MLVYTLASPVLSQQVMFTTIFFIKQVKNASAFCCFEPGREIREFALLIGRAYIPVADSVFADFLFRGIDAIWLPLVLQFCNSCRLRRRT